MTIRIVKAVHTCTACPSQWDAWTDDGTYLYLRYRYGIGTTRAYSSLDAFGHEAGTLVDEFDTGAEWDGSIGLATFCRLAGLELALVEGGER